jgi:hypothetical protein
VSTGLSRRRKRDCSRQEKKAKRRIALIAPLHALYICLITCFVGVGGLSDRYFSKDLADLWCFASCAIVAGVCGWYTLDLLDGRLGTGVGVRSDILSFESIASASNGTNPAALKLFWIVFV